MKEICRPVFIEVNLDNIKYNINLIKSKLDKNIKICVVVKGDSNNLGISKIIPILIENGINEVAVSCLNEAIEIRKMFKDISILNMGYTLDKHLYLVSEYNIIQTISCFEQAEILNDLKSDVKVAVKINTGFNRLGFKFDDIDNIKKVFELDGIIVTDIFSHFAEVVNDKLSNEQFDKFEFCINKLKEKGVNIPLRHIAASEGIFKDKKYHLDKVRIGIVFLGVNSNEDMRKISNLKGVVSLKSYVAKVSYIEKGEGVSYSHTFIANKKTKIITVPIGYADGLIRYGSNKIKALVNGKYINQIGNICMGNCMFDVTGIDVKREDIVTFLGKDLDKEITIFDIATRINTSVHNILTGISRRVPRVYIKNDEVIDYYDYLN